MNATCSLSWLVLLAPLGALALLVATVISAAALLRPGKDGQRVGGCGGCLIGLGVLVVLGLGALGCTALTVVGLASSAVENGPVRSVELDWTPAAEPVPPGEPGEPGEPGKWAEPGEPSAPSAPVRLRVTLDGSLSSEELASLSRALRRRSRGDLSLRVEQGLEDGREVTRLEFGLPVEPEELERVERELREELPELELPGGVRIELRRR